MEDLKDLQAQIEAKRVELKELTDKEEEILESEKMAAMEYHCPKCNSHLILGTVAGEEEIEVNEEDEWENIGREGIYWELIECKCQNCDTVWDPREWKDMIH